MVTVQNRLLLLTSYARDWLTKIADADRMVFESDRAAWDAMYASVNSEVPLAMTFLLRDQQGDESKPPSPRFEAIEDLWARKNATDETAEESAALTRSEERRVGKEDESQGVPAHENIHTTNNE